jgi:hypothetical protein
MDSLKNISTQKKKMKTEPAKKPEKFDRGYTPRIMKRFKKQLVDQGVTYNCPKK